MEPTPKKYFTNLDAARFFSFLHIFSNHVIFTNSAVLLKSGFFLFAKTYITIGFFGIDFFFVLSSFLITWIIIEEQARTGNFRLIYFAIRRSLRLWPLYFLVVIFGFALVALGRHYGFADSSELPPFYHFLFFTLNFYIIENGEHFLFFLVFFWSISIEEQFYLAWALFLKWGKKIVVPMCVVLIALSLVFRYYYYGDNLTLVYHTVSLFGNFGAGALLAYACFYDWKFLRPLKQMPTWAIAAVYVFILLNIVFYIPIYDTKWLIIPERLIFALFFCFIIFEQEFCTNSFIKLGRWKFINYLGSMSFGLYCFHGIIITALIKLSEKFPQLCDSPLEVYFINPVVILALTIGISIVSYEYFEKHMLKLKNKFYPVQ